MELASVERAEADDVAGLDAELVTDVLVGAVEADVVFFDPGVFFWLEEVVEGEVNCCESVAFEEFYFFGDGVLACWGSCYITNSFRILRRQKNSIKLQNRTLFKLPVH